MDSSDMHSVQFQISVMLGVDLTNNSSLDNIQELIDQASGTADTLDLLNEYSSFQHNLEHHQGKESDNASGT